MLGLGKPSIAISPTIPYQQEFAYIGGNSLLPITSPLLSKNLSYDQLEVLETKRLNELVRNKYQQFLKEELSKIGKTEKDFCILKEVFQCESSWRQFDNTGNVLISEGNVGICQINIVAHQKTYTEMSLDIYEPYDNLSFGVFLYQRDGLKPWLKWSGHCFLPKILKCNKI